MTWLSWRLQRTESVIALALLGLIAALLLPTGIRMADAYHADGLGACLSVNPSAACAQAVGEFNSRFGRLSNLMAWFTLLPGLLARRAELLIPGSRVPHRRLRRTATTGHAPRHLPARESLLAAPGPGDGAVRRHGAGAAAVRSLVDAPAHRLRSDGR